MTRLVPGQKAPPFSTTTWDRKPLGTKDFLGRKLWLVFFRHVNCPFCLMRVHEMRDLCHENEAAMQVVGIFQSPAEKFEQGAATGRVWFPMISDPQESLYALYGLEASLRGVLNLQTGVDVVRGLAQGFPPRPSDGTFTRMPADFLIGPTGSIVDAFYGSGISEHIPLARVRAFLGAAA